MIYVLANPKSNNGRGKEDAKAWAETNLKKKYEIKSVIKLDYKKFFDGLEKNDEVVLCGGDGTVNYFVNEIYGYEFKNPLYYAKCGSGNDFYRDVEKYEKDGKVELTQFITNLPLVTVNGIKKRFLNGIGYGIDGDTCLVGDKIRELDASATINYTAIAIGLLLKPNGFKTKKATVTVDGVTHTYENVWLSSAMYGRYYGGGMNAAPDQDRKKAKGKVTVTTFASKGRLKTFLRFPSFSGGKHEGKTYLHHDIGKVIEVTFDEPCALQIDGDVVPNVTTYKVEFTK